MKVTYNLAIILASGTGVFPSWFLTTSLRCRIFFLLSYSKQIAIPTKHGISYNKGMKEGKALKIEQLTKIHKLKNVSQILFILNQFSTLKCQIFKVIYSQISYGILTLKKFNLLWISVVW